MNIFQIRNEHKRYYYYQCTLDIRQLCICVISFSLHHFLLYLLYFLLISFLYSILSLFHKTRHQCGQKRKNFIAQRNLFLPWYDNKLFDSCIIACAYWRFHTEPEKHFCATASQYLMLLNHLCLLGVNTSSTCTG